MHPVEPSGEAIMEIQFNSVHNMFSTFHMKFMNEPIF